MFKCGDSNQWEALKLIKKNTVKTHPCEVMYVVVYWLHGFNPFLVRLFVLSTAIVLSANRDMLTLYCALSAKHEKYSTANKQHAFRHRCPFIDNIKFIIRTKKREKSLEKKLKLKMMSEKMYELEKKVDQFEIK